VAKRYSAFSSSGSRVSVSTIDPPNHTAKPISHVVFLSTIVRHFTHDLAIIPVLNKIDLPSARVDAGYGYLAFQASHALLRDIPLDAGNKKAIGAKYAFAGRGSPGPPRKKALGVDLHGDVD